MKLKKLPWLSAGLFAALLSGNVAAQTDSAAATAEVGKNSLPLDELQAFAEVFGQINSQYVDPADDLSLLRDALHGMLAGLDPHSVFLDAEAFEEMRVSTEGQFGGLGIEVTTSDGLLVIVAPLDDTPAQRAGLQPGDMIVKLDGVAVQGDNLRAVTNRLRGPPGSKIVLTISRRGQRETFDVTLVRAIIKVSNVKSEMLEDGFAYIRITSFHSQSGANLRAALAQLQPSDGELNGLVLDLRNNPGGTLHSAVEVSDVFINDGVIVSTRGRNPATNQTFSASARAWSAEVPLVVLVNGGSASAAEIVAGALQDHQRAILLGTQTFGKGSVQTVIPLQNGGALKLTTARYYTPSGRSIQARGITPDIIAEQVNAQTQTQLSRSQVGKPTREDDLFGHLENDQTTTQPEPAKAAHNSRFAVGHAETETETKPIAALQRRDYQVGAALNLLKGMSLVKRRRENSQADSANSANPAAAGG